MGANFSATPIVQTTFVSGSMMTVAQLLANYPANAARVGLYARVSDLFGSVDDIMRCRYDGTAYRWVPQRDTFAGTSAATGGAVSLLPLVTPPTLRMTAGTLVSNVTISASTVNAYIGQRFRVIMSPTINLGLFTMQITSLIGSNITLLAGNTRDIEYGSTGWFQSA